MSEELETITAAELYEDIVGVWEVAHVLGVPIRRVRRWIERREQILCPKPIKTLHCGFLYSLADWKGWYALWRLTHPGNH